MTENVLIKTETICKEEIELIDISDPLVPPTQVKPEVFVNQEAIVRDKDKPENESGTRKTIFVHDKALININGVLYLIEKIPEASIQSGQTFKVVPKVDKNVPKVNKNKGTLLDTDCLSNVCIKCNISMPFHTRECNKCGSSNRWQCKECKRNFKSLPDARYHSKMVCKPIEYYHCVKCDYRTVKKFRMDLHTTRAHPGLNASDIPNYIKKTIATNPDAHVCSKCGMKFKDDIGLNRHRFQCQRKRKKIQSFANLSGKDTSSQSTEFIMRHCKTCKKDVELKELQGPLKSSCSDCLSTLVYKCTRCGELHETYDAVVSHVNMVVDCQKQFRCNECSYTTFSEVRFETHQKRSHGDISATCTNCGSYFRKLTLFERHVAYCGIATTLHCKLCPFITSKSEYLKKHIIATHKRRKPVKVINGTPRARYAFNKVRPNIQTFCIPCHRRQTTTYRVKFCKICNGNLEFRCIACDKMYQVDKTDACEHVKAYLEWISRECKRCGRGFVSNKRLRLHEEWCGKTKSYNCKLCIYSTKYVKYLRAHEREAHPNAVFEDLYDSVPSSENDVRTEPKKINSRKKPRKLSRQDSNKTNENHNDSTSHKIKGDNKLNMQCKVVLTRLVI